MHDEFTATMGHPFNESHERPGKAHVLPAFIQPLIEDKSNNDNEHHELGSLEAGNDTWVGLQRAASLTII